MFAIHVSCGLWQKRFQVQDRLLYWVQVINLSTSSLLGNFLEMLVLHKWCGCVSLTNLIFSSSPGCSSALLPISFLPCVWWSSSLVCMVWLCLLVQYKPNPHLWLVRGLSCSSAILPSRQLMDPTAGLLFLRHLSLFQTS